MNENLCELQMLVRFEVCFWCAPPLFFLCSYISQLAVFASSDYEKAVRKRGQTRKMTDYF